MQVLLLGGGGREHALAWAMARSPRLTKLWAAPGSDAIAQHAECVALNPLNGAAVALFARDRRIDLVVIGPEAPLAAGVADALEAAGVPVLGPSAAAARLETSKSFAREVADAAGAPGPGWARVETLEAGLARLRETGAPVVVKADGLAAGKGVTVAADVAEAEAALRALFAEKGAAAVLEDVLQGEEASLFALCHGEDAVAFGAAQDHKRAFDGDRGPNTGGMGAYAPAPVLTPEVEARAMDRIVRPVLAEMKRRGTPFRGVLYAGLMIDQGEPRLVEFNVRLGDPEAQVLAMRHDGDLLETLRDAAGGALAAPRWRDEAVVGVTLAANGYPGGYARGEEIRGLDPAAALPGVRIFHAGTRRSEGRWLSDGGRALTVCAAGADVREARERAYAAVDAIDWPGGFHRRDIARRALGG
jgi:phosphoribosylamine--glycine ligase